MLHYAGEKTMNCARCNTEFEPAVHELTAKVCTPCNHRMEEARKLNEARLAGVVERLRVQRGFKPKHDIEKPGCWHKVEP